MLDETNWMTLVKLVGGGWDKLCCGDGVPNPVTL